MIQLLGVYPKELHHKAIILQLKINKKINKENENRNWKRYLHSCVNYSISHSSKALETT